MPDLATPAAADALVHEPLTPNECFRRALEAAEAAAATEEAKLKASEVDAAAGEGSEAEPPAWLRNSVDRVVQLMATEQVPQHVPQGGRPRRGALRCVLSLGILIAAVAAAVAAILLSSLSLTADSSVGTPSASTALVARLTGGSSVATAAAAPADASQWALAFRDTAQGMLDKATNRGDQAVLAATRCAATLEHAQHRHVELSAQLKQAKDALQSLQAALRSKEAALVAKEEALARLEDLHSHTSQQLDEQVGCCKGALKASGRLEERTQRCERQLSRAEHQLEQEQAARVQQEQAAREAARRQQQQQQQQMQQEQRQQQRRGPAVQWVWRAR